MKYLITLTLIMILSGCSSRDDATRALTSAGFTDITITGYSFLSCSEDDFYSTGFRAKNIQGVYVEGAVCSGLFFKNATIRY